MGEMLGEDPIWVGTQHTWCAKCRLVLAQSAAVSCKASCSMETPQPAAANPISSLTFSAHLSRHYWFDYYKQKYSLRTNFVLCLDKTKLVQGYLNWQIQATFTYFKASPATLCGLSILLFGSHFWVTQFFLCLPQSVTHWYQPSH